MASYGGNRSGLGLMRMRNIVAGCVGSVADCGGAVRGAAERGDIGSDKYAYTSSGATAGHSADSDGCDR